MTSQKFGGDWTAKKLKNLRRYILMLLPELEKSKLATVKHIWQGLQRGRCLQRNGLITTILLRAMKAKRPSLNT